MRFRGRGRRGRARFSSRFRRGRSRRRFSRRGRAGRLRIGYRM